MNNFNLNSNQYQIIEEEFIDMSNSQQNNKYELRTSNGGDNYANAFNHRETTEQYITLQNSDDVYNAQRRSSFKKLYPAGPYGLAQPGLFINNLYLKALH